MLPYRPELSLSSQRVLLKPVQINNQIMRLKPIPSMQLIHSLQLLCENSQNSYDSKNHVLTLNDINNFQLALHDKFARSLKSFQRQLKILGFKISRKYRYGYQDQGNYNGNQENNRDKLNQAGTIILNHRNMEIRIFKWKGKKQLLIQQQLGFIQKGLKQRKSDMQNLRKKVREHRQMIDNKIQQILLGMLIDFNSQTTRHSLNSLILDTKSAVNDTQLNLRKVIQKISNTLGNQLQLYKLLIYKQGSSQGEKKMQDRGQEQQARDQAEGQGEGEGEGEGEDGQQGQDYNNQEYQDNNMKKQENNGYIKEEDDQQNNNNQQEVSIQVDNNNNSDKKANSDAKIEVANVKIEDAYKNDHSSK